MADRLDQQVMDALKTLIQADAAVTAIVGSAGVHIALPWAPPVSACPCVVIVPDRAPASYPESSRSRVYLDLQLKIQLFEVASLPENKAEMLATDVISKLSALDAAVGAAIEAEFPPHLSGSAFENLGVQNFERTDEQWRYPEPGANVLCAKILDYEFRIRHDRTDATAPA